MLQQKYMIGQTVQHAVPDTVRHDIEWIYNTYSDLICSDADKSNAYKNKEILQEEKETTNKG